MGINTSLDIGTLQAQQLVGNPNPQADSAAALYQVSQSTSPVQSAQTPPIQGNPAQKLNQGQQTIVSVEVTKKLQNALTITKHPHLDAKTSEIVKKFFEPSKEDDKPIDGFFTSELRRKGILKDNKINFEALGLPPKTIKKAEIKGEIFLKDNLILDFKITGKCSKEAKKCMQALKAKLDDEKSAYLKAHPGMKNTEISEININPDNFGPLSHEDKTIIDQGGQIRCLFFGNQMLKLTLDPGKDGDDDGLTISFYPKESNKYVNPDPKLVKIPLNVVFEGAKSGENPGIQPLLPKWREQKLFENSVINEQYSRKFFSRTKIIEKTNQDDQERIQAKNTLWNAVFEYLKINTTEVNSQQNDETIPQNQQTTNAPKELEAETPPTEHPISNNAAPNKIEKESTIPGTPNAKPNPDNPTKIPNAATNRIKQESATQETLEVIKLLDLLREKELKPHEGITFLNRLIKIQNTNNLDYEIIQNKINEIEAQIPEANKGYFKSLITINASLKPKIETHG